MTRIEQVTKSIRNIEDLPSDDVHTALLAEIALSLAVIVDMMIEKKDGENHDE
jgi:hypothetical protein